MMPGRMSMPPTMKLHELYSLMFNYGRLSCGRDSHDGHYCNCERYYDRAPGLPQLAFTIVEGWLMTTTLPSATMSIECVGTSFALLFLKICFLKDEN